jgi:ElaB/YqjD/DUF883 family membrane-anchored ribosome-binding protein
MAENKTALPEGTDKVIAGAAAENAGRDTNLVTSDTTLVKEKELPVPAPKSERSIKDSADASTGLAERLRSGSEKLSNQAGEKARGLVTQGLERSAEALANVSKLVGETAPGLEERLGPEYGDYARKAAAAIENTATAIADKDPDELIEDTRNFVRNSPGLAIAGAAVVGFVVARLLKTGLARDDDDDDDED